MEITGLQELYNSLYSIKYKQIKLLDNKNKVIKVIAIEYDDLDNDLVIPRLGIKLKSPNTIIINKNTEIIYYKYDKNNKEIIDNINEYKNQLKQWNNRPLIQKLKDYNENKKFNTNIDYSKTTIDSCEMFTTLINPIEYFIHDNKTTAIKIQGLTKKKPLGFNWSNMLTMAGIALLVMGIIIYLSGHQIRLW